ncbi:hypothetical protein BGX26_008104 [Mortierella sp. AD094]|nr:hypothetical protein BGX26_008104 [Mortierella sp. AD094]
MSALATMKEPEDTEPQGHQHTASTTQHSQSSLEQKRERPTTQAPKLTIIPFEIDDSVASASSSAASSPTSSTFPGSMPQKVSFRFSSPVFYDQKLHIYQSLSALYQRLGRSIVKYPHVLMALQYSIATIHGTTLYFLSVILSIAQLIMITFTVENLDWIQSHKPLMHEWNSRFPGFVFPAMDIGSEDEEDALEDSINHRGGRYWASKKKLKNCDDPASDWPHSEEFKRCQNIKQSMNSTLRKRLYKYQQWIPCTWAAEEGAAFESEGSEIDAPSNIRHTFVSKRVTFNEQVLVFGRGRSSQVSQPPPYEITPIIGHATHAPEIVSHTTEAPHTTNNSASTQASKEDVPVSTTTLPKSSPSSADMATLDTLLQEEAKFQESMVSEDINSSGSSSPVFQPDARRTPISPSSAPTSATFQDTTPHLPATPPPSVAPSVAPSVVSNTPVQPCPIVDTTNHKTLARIGSLLHLHLHHGNGHPKNGVCRSATRSELEEATQPVLPSPPPPQQPNTESDVISLASVKPEQEDKQETLSRSSSLSLKTRASRSFSVGLPKRHHNNGTEGEDSDNASLEHGSADKHKNLMYRIVHPQRYKRELEQHQSEKEQQRLLTLVQLQHRLILGTEGENAPSSPRSSGTFSSPSDPSTALCGNAYYYATSAEFVEGLGAHDSVISTSVGTSFPEELQAKKSKNRTKQPPPLALAAATTCSNGEGVHAETTEQHSQKSPHRSLFKRDSKKTEAGSGVRPRSTSQLHQFFHPGHKHTQSTTSPIRPATICSETALMEYDQSAVSPAVRFASHGRSNSRAFTTFTALGVPVNPPVKTAVAPPNAVCPISAMLPSQDPAMEHTTFAAFSFPSPGVSPTNSASPSPRNSLNVMPIDQVIHDGDVTDDGRFGDHDNQEPETHMHQQSEQGQQEIPLIDKGDSVHVAELKSDGNDSMDNSSEPAATKPHRGLSFIRKLSIKKKKN